MRQRLGVLCQGSALYVSINTFENVAFPLRYFADQSEEEIRHNVYEALGRVGLKDAADKGTSEPYGGMRKRVGLASAIILRPGYPMYDASSTGTAPRTSA